MQATEKRLPVTGVKFDASYDHTDQWALGCQYEGARYHIWLNVVTGEVQRYNSHKPPTLYKNVADKRASTRLLDARNKRNAPIVAAMLAEMNEHGLIAAERSKLAAAARAKEIEHARHVRDNAIAAAAPQFHIALQGIEERLRIMERAKSNPLIPASEAIEAGIDAYVIAADALALVPVQLTT